MMTIHKYPLKAESTQIVLLPKCAKILCAQFQRESLCIWVHLNPEGYKVERTIEIHGTGYPMDFFERNYIGTAQDPVNGLVWHVFEKL